MHIVRLNAPTSRAKAIPATSISPAQGFAPRWKAGHDDTARALEKRPWENEVDPMAGVAVHDCEPTILGKA